MNMLQEPDGYTHQLFSGDVIIGVDKPALFVLHVSERPFLVKRRPGGASVASFDWSMVICYNGLFFWNGALHENIYIDYVHNDVSLKQLMCYDLRRYLSMSTGVALFPSNKLDVKEIMWANVLIPYDGITK